MTERRFPPPWSAEELDACFVVTDKWQLGRGNPSRLGIHPPGWISADIDTSQRINKRRNEALKFGPRSAATGQFF